MPTPPLDFFKLDDAEKPRIGFRVFVSSGDERCRNTLRSRDPHADATILTLEHHLTWKKEPSPFVSLWTSWRRAVNWARSRAKSGGMDIDIAAVWIHDRDIYDAYDASKILALPPKKLLDYHQDEVILVDRGGEADFSIIAQFHCVTERQWEMVTFNILGEESLTSLPIGPLDFEPRSDEERMDDTKAESWRNRGFTALWDEVVSRTEISHRSKTCTLARVLCKQPCSTRPVMVLTPSSQRVCYDELVALLEEIKAQFNELFARMEELEVRLNELMDVHG